MNKKFISALLFGAMLLAPASMFVSCSYDDDIAELRDDLNATKTDLSSLLDEKMKNVDAEIVALGSQAEALEAAYKAADEALQEAIANATNDAKGYADVQAAQAQAASIAAAQKMVEDAKAALEAALAAVNSTVAEQGKSIAVLVEADKELTSAITAAQARAEEAFALASQAKELATQNAAALKALEEAVKGLEATVATLSGQVNVLGEKVASLEKAAQDNAAAIAAQAATIEALKASNAAALESAKGELQTAIEANAEEIKALEAAVEAAKAEAATAIAEAKAVAAQAVEDAKAALAASFSDAIADAKAAYEAADKALADEIAAVKEIADKNAAAIDGIQKSLVEANSNLLYESKRLKSLVFAPTDYVNGVECIKFVTLNYKNWEKYYADDANGSDTKLYYIDDANTTVEYLVNPKNVLKNDITALSFISNKASNDTRAVSEDAPIAVESFNINNGVMSVVLDKKVTESFGISEDNFTIVSLKATLSDKFLTEEEVENGEKAEVYSDWARLYETAVTPYIHNKATNKVINNVLTHVENAEAAHFWKYSDLYKNAATPEAAKLPTAENGKYIAAEVVYTESIDLMTLVEVCDKNGKHYDPEAYGLEFRFNEVTYQLLNQNSATDFTDQQHFAKLNGSVLTSTARDGVTEKNRDAIGRQPAIQVVLFDKVNNKTVDVKYFKIKWVANTPDAPSVTVKDFGELGKFTEAYGCSISIQKRVLEETVNALYTFAGTSGMSRDEFHQTYELVPGLYASLAEINKANPGALNTVDTFVEQPDNSGAGQTWNYLYTINTAGHKMGIDEYIAGKKEFTVYGYFRNKINSNDRIAFALKFTLTINEMGLDGYNLDQTMWANDLRHINPALETDANLGNTTYATTQIVGSLLEGYIKNGQTPGDVIEMMKKVNGNTPNAKFVFDEKVVATWGEGWTVSADGSTLLKGLVVAATVHPTLGTIQLKESNNGASNSVPTTAAKELVGNTAPVKIVADWCDITAEMEMRNVKFLTPLAFSSNEAQVELYDITAGGSSEATIAGKLQIKEVYTTNKRVVWDNKTTNSETKPALVAWYKVSTPVYDVANAKTNITLDGVIGNECTTKLSDLKNSNGSQKYTVAVDPATSKVTFHNMSGNAIGQSFKIEIPVTVTTKWQDGMTAKIVVTVKPSI